MKGLTFVLAVVVSLLLASGAFAAQRVVCGPEGCITVEVTTPNAAVTANHASAPGVARHALVIHPFRPLRAVVRLFRADTTVRVRTGRCGIFGCRTRVKVRARH